MALKSDSALESLTRLSTFILTMAITIITGMILASVNSLRTDVSMLKENQLRLTFQVENLERRVDVIANGTTNEDIIRRIEALEAKWQGD